MSLKDELYAQNKGKTLAENIDRAWAIYSDEGQVEKDRKVAQAFLIYAFNLKRLDNINQQLLTLMHERNKHKATNPEYIPGLSPRHLKLDPNEMPLARTAVFKVTSQPKLKKLFADSEMLDVNASDKQDDLSVWNPTRYFNSQERAQYRVHIYNGQFYQRGEVFDTTGYEAHSKRDYAAFTINANGEISIFRHLGMTDHIAHSSMNSGSPVVCAGEIMIKNGKLMAINTHSGHYRPSLFNIYRALEFFSDKGVDISKAKVQIFSDPSNHGLKVKSSRVGIPSTDGWGNKYFYEIPASVFFKSIKDNLDHELHSIKADTEKYQSFSFTTMLYRIKDSIIKSTLTQDRMDLSVKVQDIATQLLSKLTDNDLENKDSIEKLIKELEKIREENNQLSIANGKSPNSGRLHARLETFLREAHALSDLKHAMSEEDMSKMKLAN